MQSGYIHIPTEPAGIDEISIELFSEQTLNADIKASLGNHLISRLPKAHGNRVLIIGGNAGKTAELLIPYCDRIDIVVEKAYLPILEALYKKR